MIHPFIGCLILLQIILCFARLVVHAGPILDCITHTSSNSDPKSVCFLAIVPYIKDISALILVPVVSIYPVTSCSTRLVLSASYKNTNSQIHSEQNLLDLDPTLYPTGDETLVSDNVINASNPVGHNGTAPVHFISGTTAVEPGSTRTFSLGHASEAATPVMSLVPSMGDVAPLSHLPAINVPTFSPLIAADVANVPSPVPASDDVAPLCQPAAPSSGSALPLSSPHHDVSEASTQLKSVAERELGLHLVPK
jgi:hypothetical protein